MYMSKMFIPTLREAPNDAEIASHKLMIRAGLTRNLVSGVYSFLPLGIRVIEKIKAIIQDGPNCDRTSPTLVGGL
jgi:prolyl-tRNA synthetase